MPDDEDNIFGKCFDLMDSGADRNAVLAFLRTQNLTVIEALLVTMKLYGLRMEQARQCLVTHPSWQVEVAGMVSPPWADGFLKWLKAPVVGQSAV